MDNEEAITARAIFGEVYTKMHAAATHEKNYGERDHENIEKAKRLFGQVFERMNHSLKQSRTEVVKDKPERSSQRN